MYAGENHMYAAKKKMRLPYEPMPAAEKKMRAPQKHATTRMNTETRRSEGPMGSTGSRPRAAGKPGRRAAA
jgi:hypothetical protein